MAQTTQKLDPQLRERVATILRRDLKLGPDVAIDDDMPLIGGDFELDSLDVVLLITSVEKEFGLKIANETLGRDAFSSVRSLVQFLQQRANQPAANGHAPHPAVAAASVNGSARAHQGVDEDKHEHQVDAAGTAFDHLLAALPHREPFRFISRLCELAPQVHGEGEWVVTGDEGFFAGHFPDQPIVPGVLVSEALAQLSGLVGADPRAADPTGTGAAQLAHIDVKLRRAVAPPATITLRSRMLQDLQGMQRFEVEALLRGDVIAEGQITLKRTDAR